jgi:predicted nucleic acid-binding protein
MRVFLDANVLFSASNAGSNIAKLIRLLLSTAEAVTSDLAHEEARRNILLKRPAWSSDFDELVGREELVASVHFTLPVALDDKDVPILCTAIRAQCRYLVTGDKRDFGHLYDKQVKGVTIISPARLASILIAEKNK